jgi:hypothetical protein
VEDGLSLCAMCEVIVSCFLTDVKICRSKPGTSNTTREEEKFLLIDVEMALL